MLSLIELISLLTAPLRSQSRSATKESEAAAIASLVGGAGSAAAAVAQAQARFRGLPLSRLSAEDMLSNKPAPELFAKTENTDLGKADLVRRWSSNLPCAAAVSAISS